MMTGQEVFHSSYARFTVSLRNSSIRPDLEVLLKELLELGVKQFDRFFLQQTAHILRFMKME